MDVERTENFYPITTLSEDVEKIVLMKAALIAITDEHERSFLTVQNLVSRKRDLVSGQNRDLHMPKIGSLAQPGLSTENKLRIFRCETLLLTLFSVKININKRAAWKNRLKAGKRQIERCTQESNSLELRINAVETKITDSLLSNQAAEAEALNTVRENRCLKRKIIALKHDMEQQEKLLQRASETLSAVNKCVKNKKLKELSTVSA